MTVLSIQRGMDLSMHSDGAHNNSPAGGYLELQPCMGALGLCDGAGGAVVQNPG